MNLKLILPLFAALAFGACGSSGQEGDECETNADCADGLECHLHEHDGETSDHGECEAEEHEHDDTDHGDTGS